MRDSNYVPEAEAGWRVDVGRATFGSSVARLSRWRNDKTLDGVVGFCGVPIETLSLDNARSAASGGAATDATGSLSHRPGGTLVVIRFQRSMSSIYDQLLR